MVRTRGGASTSECDGKGRCRRWSRGRWRATRACSRCRPRGCRNAAVCGSTATRWSSSDFYCSQCVVFLACRPIHPAGAGECPVCLDAKPLFGVPGCDGGHALCAECLRRVWMGTDALPATPADIVPWTARNRDLIQHRQVCPCCRASDRDGRVAARGRGDGEIHYGRGDAVWASWRAVGGAGADNSRGGCESAARTLSRQARPVRLPMADARGVLVHDARAPSKKICARGRARTARSPSTRATG